MLAGGMEARAAVLKKKTVNLMTCVCIYMYMREYAYIYISCKHIAPPLFFPHFTVD